MATGTFPYAKKRNFWRPFLAGVAAPNREGGWVGSFKAGLAGAIGQNAADEQAAKAAAEEELRRQMEERLFGLKERATAADEQRAKADMITADRQKPDLLSPYDRRTQEMSAGLDFLNAHPDAAGKGIVGHVGHGGSAKPTAMRANVQYLMDQGYSLEDALAIVEKMIPTISTGETYDPFAQKVIPTRSSRTPQVPTVKPPPVPLAPVPSHRPAIEGVSPLAKFVRHQ